MAEATDTIFCKDASRVYASKQDLLNYHSIEDEVDIHWLREKFGLKRPLYYIDHKGEIETQDHEDRIDTINLVTNEVTYRYGMDGFFFTENELKASRPDLFPETVKVRVTKEYTLSVEKDKLEEFKAEVHNIDLEPMTDDKEYGIEVVD